MVKINISDLLSDIIFDQHKLYSFINTYYKDLVYLIEKSFLLNINKDLFFDEDIEIKKEEFLSFLKEKKIKFNFQNRDKENLKKFLRQNKSIVTLFFIEKIKNTYKRHLNINFRQANSINTFEINNKWDEFLLKYLLIFKTKINQSSFIYNYKNFLYTIDLPFSFNFFQDFNNIYLHSLILNFTKQNKIKESIKPFVEKELINETNKSTDCIFLHKFIIEIMPYLKYEKKENNNLFYILKINFLFVPSEISEKINIKNLNSLKKIMTLNITKKIIKEYKKENISEKEIINGITFYIKTGLNYTKKIKKLIRDIITNEFWKENKYKTEKQILKINNLIKTDFFEFLLDDKLIKKISKNEKFSYIIEKQNPDFCSSNYISKKLEIIKKADKYLKNEKKIQTNFNKIKSDINSFLLDRFYKIDYKTSLIQKKIINFFIGNDVIKYYQEDFNNLYTNYFDKVNDKEKKEFQLIIEKYLSNQIFPNNIPEYIFQWKQNKVLKFIDFFNFYMFKKYIYSDKQKIGDKYINDIITDGLVENGNFFIPALFVDFLIKEKYSDIEDCENIFEINPFLKDEKKQKEKILLKNLAKILTNNKTDKKTIEKEIKKTLILSSDKNEILFFAEKKIEKPYTTFISNAFKEKGIAILVKHYLEKKI